MFVWFLYLRVSSHPPPYSMLGFFYIHVLTFRTFLTGAMTNFFSAVTAVSRINKISKSKRPAITSKSKWGAVKSEFISEKRTADEDAGDTRDNNSPMESTGTSYTPNSLSSSGPQLITVHYDIPKQRDNRDCAHVISDIDTKISSLHQ